MTIDAPTAAASPEQLELVLQRVDALPTLGAVAARLLEVTANDQSSASDVVRLIESDPALSAKVLRACRRSDRGRALKIGSVEKAVVLMGFDAVRAAALSVQVFEVLDRRRGTATSGFDRVRFWRHCVATAILAERIAPPRKSLGIERGEAFTAGLLHDLGHLALHAVLPHTYETIARLSDEFGRSIDETCCKLVGLDTHGIGKRLAERWLLPQRLVDAIWLNGQPAVALPEASASALVQIVTLADALARQAHLAPAGQAPHPERLSECGAQLHMSEADFAGILRDVYDDVAHRAAGLGLDDHPAAEVLADALSRANELLGSFTESKRKMLGRIRRREDVIGAIASFHHAAIAASTMGEAIGSVGRSAASLLQGKLVGGAFKRTDEVMGAVWSFEESGLAGSQWSDTLDGFEALADSLVRPAATAGAWPVWLRTALTDTAIALQLKGDEWSAGLVLDGASASVDQASLRLMASQWILALQAAARQERVGALAEQLVQANRRLVASRDELVRRRAMASLGELAAGAAHEFNNPLTVISSRAQLARERAVDLPQRSSLTEIIQQAQRLSDMVSALHELSRPLKVDPASVDATEWLRLTVSQVENSDQVVVQVPEASRQVRLDPRLMADAIQELLRNAREADPRGKIAIVVQSDPLDGRWILRLADNGPGLSEKGLAHAFDPFFSDKPAGRRTGLGLARARRIVEAHGGELSLTNRSPRGAVATIRLPQPRLPGRSNAAAA